jgi:predicted extracellular nuclease
MQVNTAGTDFEFFEIAGAPATDLSSLTLIGVESDFGASAGTIDKVISLSAQTIPADGFWVAANPTAVTTYNITPDMNIPADTFENSTATYFLVSAFTGALLDDLDTDDNGMLDSTPWTVIIDSVNIRDTGATDFDYGAPITGPDGSNQPSGIFRCPDLTGSFSATFLNFATPNGTPGVSNATLCAGDVAPTVTDTTPADNATNIAANTNITVTFDEAVNVSGTIKVEGSSSGIQNVTPTGGPTTFALDPTVDFTAGETVTITVLGSQVADQDGTPNNMAADYVFDFTINSGVAVCDQAFTPIYDIQGSGPTVAITTEITTEGVVVGDYEGASPSLRGFYIQDATGDTNAATSDGIFVFDPTNTDNVAVGDVVRVTGTPGENQGQSQIGFLNGPIVDCGTGTVTTVDVTLPVASATFLEQYEGMLVRLPQTLYVTEHFQLGRFGQVVLSSGGRLQQPTNVALPGAPALALQAGNNLNRIIVDDGLNSQNPDPILFGRGGNPLSAGNTLRGGDTAANIVGVMTYTWAGNSASGNAYRVRPINALSGSVPNFQAVNLRPASAPAPTGSLRIGGMNVLNYFNTFDGFPDSVDNCALGVGGASADCRGADTQVEFDRQWPKTVAALVGSGADVIGLGEIENDGYGSTSAIAELTDQMNTATAPGTYAFIDVDTATGQVNALGTDAIKVGFIYKPGSVTPVGTTAALNTVAFVNGGDSAPRNRPALAQAFEEVGTGAQFIVVANHLKSKGSACNAADAGDGQGNCNTVRTNAVNELITWLGTDPTGTGDPDVLIVGDLNSYAKEDPIAALETAGYINLIAQFGGANAYSYAFDGQWGYLDHALANAAMEAQVTGTTEWHINADEPNALDYNTDFKTVNLQTTLYAPDEFRMSDHDLALVDLELDPLPDTTDPTVTINQASGQSDPTSSSPINFTVVFSEPVTGFATGDVTLSGTAGATTGTVTEIAPNDGTTYNVAVSGMTGDGTVIASIGADKAEDAAGNGNTASTSTDNTVGYVTPVAASSLFVGTTAAGAVGPLSYGSEDILKWDGSAWSMWFDGSATGLTAKNAKHNINAFWIPDADGDDVILSFTQNSRVVPGIGPKVDGMDLVKWDGSAYSLYFDGSDVSLTVKTQEKIDGLHIMPANYPSPLPLNCPAGYLLISTQGPGRVPAFGGGQIKFGGEDILGFCATNLGSNTAGWWHLVFDGSAAGLPVNAIDSISANADGSVISFTTSRPINVPGANGGHSMVFEYDMISGTFSGPVFSAPAVGINKQVDGLHIVGDLP